MYFESEMGILVAVGFKFHPPDEEIINLLSKKRLDPDFSVQLHCHFAIESEKLMRWYEYNLIHKVETRQRLSHRKTFNFRYHVIENNFSKVKSQQLSCQYLLFDSRNHVAENIIQKIGFEHVPVSNMTTNYTNHVAENILATDVLQLLPSYHWGYNSRNHVAENISPWLEYQPSRRYLTFDYRNHVAENTLLREESQLPLSYCLSSHSRNHVAEKKNFCYLSPHSRNRVAEKTFTIGQQLPGHRLISDCRDQVAEQSFSGGTSAFAQFDAL